MGWSRGSELFSRIIDAVQSNVPNEQTRVKIYEEIIKAFGDEDWDTEDECLGEDPAYDIALKRVYPEGEYDD